MNIYRGKLPLLVVFLTLLLIYTVFTTKNYYWDGISFALTIESAESLSAFLFHPNHLIYNFAGYIIYKLTLGLGLDLRAITVLQFANTFLSVAAALLLFHILKDRFRSIFIATLLALLFAFSAMWWKFSTDANAYIPSILFLLLAFFLILPDRSPRPLLVAMAHTVAMCLHQLAVFFFPVALLGIFLQTSAFSGGRRLWNILQYAGLSFVLTFGSYYTAFYLNRRTVDFREFLSWLTSYSPENGFVFNFLFSLERTLSGEIKLFFGGRFSFINDVLNPAVVLLLVMILVAVCVLLYGLFRIWRGRPVEKTDGVISENRALFLLCVTWIGVYLLFLFFWIPQNTFYRLFYLPALIILFGFILKRYERSIWHMRVAVLMVVIIALSNFVFYIYPHSKIRKETPLELATKMNARWSSKTKIYFHGVNSDNNILRYFNPDTTWQQVETITSEEFENKLVSIYAEGGDAWLETTAIKRLNQTSEGTEWLARHSIEKDRFKLYDPAYDVEVVRIVPIAKKNDVRDSPDSESFHQ